MTNQNHLNVEEQEMKGYISQLFCKSRRLFLLAVIGLVMTSAFGCAPQSEPVAEGESQETTTTEASSEVAVAYPITIEHAFGATVIEGKPERIATIAWGNHDVPLALGLVPVGVSTANYGVLDGSGLLPWTKAAFSSLGKGDPNLFNDLTALDYEGIKASNPDVILAAYSGITQEEYDLLSQIAPVVAYPTAPWQTYWRDQILQNAKGLGMTPEGEALVANLEAFIAQEVKSYPEIQGKTAAFFYFNPADLGKFYIYLPTDPRAAFLTDLGFTVPKSVVELAKASTSFAIEISAENADVLEDVDVLVAYGNQDLLKLLQADPLLGKIKGIKKGAVALVEDNTPLAAAGTPSALSIPATLPEFLKILSGAAKNTNE